jgi:signal transduction histidine kinase
LKILASKNEELESIIYVSSHDLRTPLVNIQGYAGELRECCREIEALIADVRIPGEVQKGISSILTEDIPESLGYINSGAERLDALQKGLLRLCRLGHAALSVECLDMNAMFADIVKNMQYQIDQRGATVNIETLPDCFGDRDQIFQIFTNLLDNAVKYTDTDRKGMINVSAETNNGMITYCVEDNGIGIASEHSGKLFEVFYRLDPRGSVTGDGLGLAIVRRIADRHNGKVWIESEHGKGSRFFVSLPDSARQISDGIYLARSQG